MSTGYKAKAGYGFTTGILKKDLLLKENSPLREQIVELLSEDAKKYYGSNLKELFQSGFDGEVISEIIEDHFPDLVYQWYGNPYSSSRANEKALILVKSTVASTGGIITMDKHQATTASQRASLLAAAELFTPADEPHWHLWLEVY